MRPERADEMLLVNYLLGSLSEEKQVQVEDRAFADADYLSALAAVEADLIDSYVRGQLSEGQPREFERRFLTSPGRRNKVEFAKALARVASESEPAARPAAWQALLSLVCGWNPTVQFATGLATLMLLAGGWWLVVQNAAMRSRVVALEAERHDLETREQTLKRQLAAQSQKQPAPAPPAGSWPVVASLVFVPGLTRAETRVEHLVLDSRAQIAHFEIQLDERDN